MQSLYAVVFGALERAHRLIGESGLGVGVADYLVLMMLESPETPSINFDTTDLRLAFCRLHDSFLVKKEDDQFVLTGAGRVRLNEMRELLSQDEHRLMSEAGNPLVFDKPLALLHQAVLRPIEAV